MTKKESEEILMATSERFDALIVGGGNGGMYLAWHLARSGRRTAVVERRWIGGSCPNINCLPSKNEIWSAKVAAELIVGSGHFVAPRTVKVRLNDGGTRVLVGDRVFLNLGTHAAIPNIPGLDSVGPMTNIEALELDYVAPHLIVLGGGYVGLELAQAYHRFGSRVTIIHHGPHVAAREDEDVADEVRRMLTDEGIDVLEAAETLGVRGRSGEAVGVIVRTPWGEHTIQGSDILVAAGRIPNTAGIGLDVAGVELDSRGYLDVNDRLETSAPNVWGIGECCSGQPQFTHVSFDDYRIIRDNLEGGNRTTGDRLVPHCMFTDPQLAHVGLTEREAQRQSIDVRVARLPMSAVLRTQTTGETRGFMKALVAAHDDRILGFTMFGSEAGGSWPRYRRR
jgi:pyruvate/2-oxoglutarate dehydrogenase complex dihydrolipoamide dehydrogenase (E3) component